MMRKTAAVVSMILVFGVLGFANADHHTSTSTSVDLSVSADLTTPKGLDGFLSLQETTAEATDATATSDASTAAPADDATTPADA